MPLTTVKCIANRSYHGLTIGREYDVVAICEGIWPNEWYVTVIDDFGKFVTGKQWRFSIDIAFCKKWADIQYQCYNFSRRQ